MKHEHYDVDVTATLRAIDEEHATRVLIQLPDGLKPLAADIQREVSAARPDVELYFWGASAFGSCDLPLHVDKLGFDLLVHFGHAAWR